MADLSKPVVTRLDQVRKAVVAVATNAAVLAGVLVAADLTTVEGLIAAGVAALGAYGVYKVPNEPLTP